MACIDKTILGFGEETVGKLNKISKLPFSVLLFNVTCLPNVGLIHRMAFLWGCTSFFIAGRRKWNRRTSIGLHNYMPVEYKEGLLDVVITKHCDEDCTCGKCKTYDVEKLMTLVEENKYYPVFIELGGTSVENVNWKYIQSNRCGGDRHLLFIMGNEKDGIPQHVLRAFKDNCTVVTVPQFGVGKCHNVAMAANIVLWEYFKTQNKLPACV